MTQMLVNYWNLMENRRANLARETETQRSNVANEAINRNRVALGYSELAERKRSNLVSEAEQHRSNVAKEYISRTQAQSSLINAGSNAAKAWQGFSPKTAALTSTLPVAGYIAGSKTRDYSTVALPAATAATKSSVWSGIGKMLTQPFILLPGQKQAIDFMINSGDSPVA